jgi:malonate transporter
MLHVLTHNILPVFAMLALGFVMGRMKTASIDEARAVNRIAFLVLQPPLIFMLLTGLDLGAIHWGALGLYALCEVIGFTLAFLLARHVLGCDLAEAWLLGMAVVFVNTLLYIWPIATLIYGEAGAMPITAIVALDASVSFAFFIISSELIAGKGDLSGAFRRMARNPVLGTILLSIALNLASVPIPEPIQTAARFAGAGAAPMMLFAMGVVLSSHSIRPGPTIAAISAAKLLGLPLLVAAAFAIGAPDSDWRQLFLMASAGPAGAMSFSLALLYGVKTDNIAPVIVWTSVLSLLSLAWLA